MAKGYWITFYRKIANPEALAAYAKLAGPKERAVLIEFESVDKAMAAFESAGYQAAAKLLVGAVERDVRIVEGT
jgi:hypothetical protein